MILGFSAPVTAVAETATVSPTTQDKRKRERLIAIKGVTPEKYRFKGLSANNELAIEATVKTCLIHRLMQIEFVALLTFSPRAYVSILTPFNQGALPPRQAPTGRPVPPIRFGSASSFQANRNATGVLTFGELRIMESPWISAVAA